MDAPYSDSGKDRFRLFQGSNIPKQLYEIMGRWRAFREVSRVTTPAPGADYTVSGTLDYKETRVRAPSYHEINVKGVVRVRVARAGDGVLILDKDFVDDQTHLKAQARQPTVGQLVDDAMAGIERDNPALKGVLPKDCARPGELRVKDAERFATGLA